MPIDNECNVVQLARRIPPDGDAVYESTLDCRPGKVLRMTSARAKAIIDEALASGVDLEHLAVELGSRQRECPHRGCTISADPRELVCDDCGMPIDPFDMLLSIARDEFTLRREIIERDQLAKELADLRRQITDAKADERRTKARVRRARRTAERQEALAGEDAHELGLWRSFAEASAAKNWSEVKRLRVAIQDITERRLKA